MTCLGADLIGLGVLVLAIVAYIVSYCISGEPL